MCRCLCRCRNKGLDLARILLLFFVSHSPHILSIMKPLFAILYELAFPMVCSHFGNVTHVDKKAPGSPQTLVLPMRNGQYFVSRFLFLYTLRNGPELCSCLLFLQCSWSFFETCMFACGFRLIREDNHLYFFSSIRYPPPPSEFSSGDFITSAMILSLSNKGKLLIPTSVGVPLKVLSSPSECFVLIAVLAAILSIPVPAVSL